MAKAKDQQPEIRRPLAEFIDALAGCITSYDVFKVLKNVCVAYGYHSFIVLRLPELPDEVLSDQIILTNWSPELIGVCDSLELMSGSPVMSRLKQSSLPFSFDLKKINVDRNDRKGKVVVSLFGEFDHLRGVMIPCTDRNGARGAVGLTGSGAEPADEALAALSYISAHTYDRLLTIEEETHVSEIQLTERERECVVWTSAGKTSAETATILGLSENTVNHYLSSAAVKLGTANKAHTVAVAIRRGLLNI